MPGDRLKDLPTPDAVATALKNALAEFSRRDKAIDAISICGNGEPTLYLALGEVIAKLKKLRDLYQPMPAPRSCRTLRPSEIPPFASRLNCSISKS
jgi:hypothetical protein